jgi:hypothetical protein
MLRIAGRNPTSPRKRLSYAHISMLLPCNKEPPPLFELRSNIPPPQAGEGAR